MLRTPIDLTAALVDIPSVSHDESVIAQAVEDALREQTSGFEIIRNGNAVLARTSRGLPSRVMLAGHLDTVPIADNVPSRRDGDILLGCGTVDMKSGDAVFLHLAATIENLAHDLTLVFYDCEEIAATYNGLGRIEREIPQWLAADVAILGEPTAGFIEAGCQGTMRVRLTASGTRAHSARSWLGGDNAIHKFGGALERLSSYQPRSVDIDGCGYREGLSAVRISGGVAGNVVPDEARWTSTSDSHPIAARYKPRHTCAKCSTVWASDSRSPTPRLARCPVGEPVRCRPDRGGRWSVPCEVRVDRRVQVLGTRHSCRELRTG